MLKRQEILDRLNKTLENSREYLNKTYFSNETAFLEVESQFKSITKLLNLDWDEISEAFENKESKIFQQSDGAKIEEFDSDSVMSFEPPHPSHTIDKFLTDIGKQIYFGRVEINEKLIEKIPSIIDNANHIIDNMEYKINQLKGKKKYINAVNEANSEIISTKKLIDKLQIIYDDHKNKSAKEENRNYEEMDLEQLTNAMNSIESQIQKMNKEIKEKYQNNIDNASNIYQSAYNENLRIWDVLKAQRDKKKQVKSETVYDLNKDEDKKELVEIETESFEDLRNHDSEIPISTKDKNFRLGKKPFAWDKDLFHKLAWKYYALDYADYLIKPLQLELTAVVKQLETYKGIRDIKEQREKLEKSISDTKHKIKKIEGLQSAALNDNFSEVADEYRFNINTQIKNSFEVNEGVIPENLAERVIKSLAKKALKDAWEFYPTPPSVIDLMLEKVEVKDGMKVLEPSAGKGDILDKVFAKNPNIQLDAIEIFEENKTILKLKGYHLIGTDALAIKPNMVDKYDLILMNPPFQDRVDIDHVRHCVQFLADNGVLLSVVTQKSLSTVSPKTAKFKEDVVRWGEVYSLPPKVMEEEGERPADVRIVVIRIDKAKFLADVANSKPKDEINENDIASGDYFKDLKTGEIWKVLTSEMDPGNKSVTIVNQIFTGEKTFDLENSVIPSSFRAIGKSDAIKAIEVFKNSIDGKRNIISCSPDTIDSACGVEGFVPITEFITARKHLAQSPKSNNVDTINLKMKPGFSLSDTALSGANLAIESLNRSGVFILTDGTGAGKTVQQLLVARHFIKQTGKSFLIISMSDDILNQAFGGDSESLGFSSLIEKMPRLDNPLDVPAQIKPCKIYLMKYDDFNLVKAQNLPELQEYNQAKSNWKVFSKSINDQKKNIDRMIKTNEVTKNVGQGMKSELNNELNNSKLKVDLLNAEDAWANWNTKVFTEIGKKFCGTAYDECHNVKNWDDRQYDSGFESKRAIWIGRPSEFKMFVSATPTDRADALYYFKEAGIFKTREEFDKVLTEMGFAYYEPKYNKAGQMVQRERWQLPNGYSKEGAAAKLQNLFEDLTEDGKMIKREIPLTNYQIEIKHVDIPAAGQDQINKIDAYFDGLEPDDPKSSPALRYGETLRALEKFKIAETIAIAEKELSECRSVVIFANLKDDSSTPKDWGDIKEGTIAALKDYFGKVYGLDKVGLIVGGGNKKLRTEDIAAFQRNEKLIMIATPQAGATGISLDDQTGERPRTLIVMTAPMNAEGNVQMLGRVYRTKTKTCPRAYYVFGRDIAIEKWLEGIVVRKMVVLNAVVGGETDKLNIGNLVDAGDVDDSLDSAQAFTESDKKVSPITSHPLYPFWDGQIIDGMKYGTKLELKAWVNIQKDWNERFEAGFINIKSTVSKQHLLSWGAIHQDKLNEFGFFIDSNRYEGSFYSAKIDKNPKNSDNEQFRKIWGWVINIFLPQRNEYINEEEQIGLPGDEVVAASEIINVVPSIPKDTVGRILNVRRRNKTKKRDPISGKNIDVDYFEYDVDFDGIIAKRCGAIQLIVRKQTRIKFIDMIGLYKDEILKETIARAKSQGITSIESKPLDIENLKLDMSGVNTKGEAELRLIRQNDRYGANWLGEINFKENRLNKIGRGNESAKKVCLLFFDVIIEHCEKFQLMEQIIFHDNRDDNGRIIYSPMVGGKPADLEKINLDRDNQKEIESVQKEIDELDEDVKKYQDWSENGNDEYWTKRLNETIEKLNILKSKISVLKGKDLPVLPTSNVGGLAKDYNELVNKIDNIRYHVLQVFGKGFNASIDKNYVSITTPDRQVAGRLDLDNGKIELNQMDLFTGKASTDNYLKEMMELRRLLIFKNKLDKVPDKNQGGMFGLNDNFNSNSFQNGNSSIISNIESRMNSLNLSPEDRAKIELHLMKIKELAA